MLLNGDGYRPKALEPLPGTVPADAAKGAAADGLPPVAQWQTPFDGAKSEYPPAAAATPKSEDGYAY